MRRDLPRRALRRDRRRARHRSRPPPGSGRLRARAARRREPSSTDEGGLVEPATLRRVGLPTTARRRRTLLGLAPARRPGRRAAPGARSCAERGPAAAAHPASASARGWPPAALVLGLHPHARPRAVLLALRRRGPRRGRHRPAAAHRLAARRDRRSCVWLVSPGGRPPGHRARARRGGGTCPVPAPARRPPVVGARARAAARHGRARARLRRRRRPRVDPVRRAGLAAAGFWWLVLGEALTGRALLFGSPDGTLPRADWEGSISAAVSDVLVPLRRPRPRSRPPSSGWPARSCSRWSCAAAGSRWTSLGAGLWAAALDRRPGRRSATRWPRSGARPGPRRRGGRIAAASWSCRVPR